MARGEGPAGDGSESSLRVEDRVPAGCGGCREVRCLQGCRLGKPRGGECCFYIERHQKIEPALEGNTSPAVLEEYGFR